MNMLGKREPDIYNTETLEKINANIQSYASGMKLSCEFFQSNSEGDIIDCLQNTEKYDGCILNAGAYSHYSYALRDCIASVGKPVIEVHMSNIYAREEFRRTSVISEVCRGVIAGFGANSYLLAVNAIRDMIK